MGLSILIHFSNAVMEDQGEQDYRNKTGGMEDSTAMTIEFLRARLISERSVSRTAKQRADDLAKRVAELEEQLKNVTLQKKKAQKTTAEVLKVLEKNGISDCIEAFDLSTDNEQVDHEDREDSKSNQEEEGSITSRRENDMEGVSDSEVEGSALPSRSLSWKGCSDNPNIVEKKYNDQVRRRQSSFVSTCGSSARPRLGKSCRQIKRRETGSAVDEAEHGPLQLDTQENGVASDAGDTASQFEDRPKISEEDSENGEGAKISEEDSEIGEGKILVRGIDSESLEDQRKETCGGIDANENKRDVESAVGNQTQLIGWYETDANAQACDGPSVNDNEGNTDTAMGSQTRCIGWYETEEAIQKEWENQARENGSWTPDSSEHGNRSDITEERDETRGAAEPTYNTISCHSQGAKFSGDSMAIVPSSGHSTSFSVEYSRDQLYNNMPVNKSLTGFFPDKNNPGSAVYPKQKKELLGNTSFGFPDDQSQQKSSFQANGRPKRESSERLQSARQHETSNGLCNVLEALQQAKFSLKQELSGLSLSNQTRSGIRNPETSLLTTKPGSATVTPLGCAGLFRVPTDLQLEASSTPQSSFLAPCSDSRSSLTKYYPDMGIGVSPYNGFTGSLNLEIGSSICTRKPYADLYLDTGMPPPSPPSTRYVCPSYADFKPRMSPEDIFPRHYPNIGAEMLSRDRYSVHSRPVRSNIYNR